MLGSRATRSPPTVDSSADQFDGVGPGRPPSWWRPSVLQSTRPLGPPVWLSAGGRGAMAAPRTPRTSASAERRGRWSNTLLRAFVPWLLPGYLVGKPLAVLNSVRWSGSRDASLWAHLSRIVREYWQACTLGMVAGLHPHCFKALMVTYGAWCCEQLTCPGSGRTLVKPLPSLTASPPTTTPVMPLPIMLRWRRRGCSSHRSIIGWLAAGSARRSDCPRS